MARSRFWRVPTVVFGDTPEEPPAVIPFDTTKIALVKRGHGILVGGYEEAKQCAIVTHLGVVLVVDKSASQIEVQWKQKVLILRPHATGAVHWKKTEVFNFEPNVAKRYLLDAIFAEEYGTLEWKNKRKNEVTNTLVKGNEEIEEPEWILEKRKAFPKSGFVYLIEIKDCFKFQGSKSLPGNSPFFIRSKVSNIQVRHAAWFTDYRYAESDLQARFHESRFDGELMYLSSGDIRRVKEFGQQVDLLNQRLDKIEDYE